MSLRGPHEYSGGQWSALPVVIRTRVLMYSGRSGKAYAGQRTLPRQLMPSELSAERDSLEVILRELDVGRKVKTNEINMRRLCCLF